MTEKTGFIDAEYSGTNEEKKLKIFDDAKNEFKYAFEHKIRGLKENHPGYLQCYCDLLKQNNLVDEIA